MGELLARERRVNKYRMLDNFLDKLTFKQDKREKTAFFASDTGKSNLDLYFAFRGVEPTNPPEWFSTLKWSAGIGVEDAVVKIFKSNGLVDEDYDQKVHGRIDIEREGIQIHGYIDAKLKDGTPVEVKSINNANKFDIQKYESNRPRENYVGQLAVYMDALGVDRGNLFVSSIDGLHRFWFDAKRDGSIVKCGETEIDLDKIYKRWADLYTNHVLKKTPPDIWEYRYKIPVDEIDWKGQSKSAIGKARNNQAVIGDKDSWLITYSPYKNLILKLQGVDAGYNLDELATIKKLTDGYTTW